MKNNTVFQRDFTLVVIGQIISLFGNTILRFALPLYLLRETGSAVLFGLVTACSFIPMIVLSLLGGVLADRVNKRNIMVALDLLTAVIVVVFTMVMDTVPMVPLLMVTLMILYGIQGAYQPAVQASIPLLASRENLMPANAIINQVSALANLLGPIIGGILFSAWGLVPILLISGGCFLFSAIMEMFISIPHKKQPTSANFLTTVKDDMAESWRFIRADKPILLRIIILVSLFNLCLSAMIMVGLPVIMINTLGVSDQLFGYAQSALAAGGLAGGIIAGFLGHKLEVTQCHLLLLIGTIAVVPMAVTLGLSLPSLVSYGIIAAMSFLLMAVSTLFSVQILAFVQGQTPVALVGKVISCLLALAMCAQPIGQAMYGILFEQFSQTPWVVVLGSAVMALLIAIYSKRIFKTMN